ncbi:MAG: Maf family protein [Bdellovibrionales bacterium]|nr:Maf family protein [Bdellovibrionales bacterium]
MILSADTVVVFKGEVLGKPKNSAEAADFLSRLSGNMHSVITGFCVHDVDSNKETLVSDESRVWFRTLARDEIIAYIASGEPFDKAGGYGIQGAAGVFVSKLEGSFSNVVGFPLELFKELEARNGWKIRT